MKIKDILVPRLTTISPEATMADADKMLKSGNIRHLPVSDGIAVIGMITDTDVSRAMTVIRTENKTQTHIQNFKLVKEYMSSPVHKKKIDEPLEDLIRDMIRMKISSFVIYDDRGNDIGIITTEDLLILLLDKVQKRFPGHFFSQLFSRT